MDLTGHYKSNLYIGIPRVLFYDRYHYPDLPEILRRSNSDTHLGNPAAVSYRQEICFVI